MRKFGVFGFSLVLTAIVSVSFAWAQCPKGQHIGGRMQGGCVPDLDQSHTYAGCIRNGRTLGYSAADVERYCKKVYSK
jgi:hypothetical protein